LSSRANRLIVTHIFLEEETKNLYTAIYLREKPKNSIAVPRPKIR